MALSKSRVYIIILLCTVLFMGACKKRRAFNDEDGQSSVDAISAAAANDEVMSDVNAAIGGQSLLRGKSSEVNGSIFPLPCGLSIDTLNIIHGMVKLNYSGQSCNNRKREGLIIIKTLNYPLKKWKNKGCVLEIEYVDYKVTNTNSGKYVSIKGIVNFTNESGGTWYDLWFTSQSNLVHTISATNLKVNYDGNSTTYNISRRLTYTFKSTGKITTCVVEGTGIKEGGSNFESWGINRKGDNYTSQITTPLKWTTACGSHVLIEGEMKVKVDTKDFELNSRFAVDEKGNDVAADQASCPYGWKLSWTFKKKTNTRIFPYN